jgi:molybdate transport system substrate-binding protein
MKQRLVGLSLVLGGLIVSSGCGKPRTDSINVYAAASTREALERIAADFQAETGIPVELNFGPSSDLARQIEQGGRADLFLSADEAWADHVADKGLVAERRDLLTNRLVVVVPRDSSLSLKDLPDLTRPEIRRLALAGAAVPAGRYARQVLEKAGLWEQLKSRVVEGGDVRATLAFVARGEVEAGFVYATDVAATSAVWVAFPVKPELQPTIRYPLVLIRQDPAKAAARRFYAYLTSPAATQVFSQTGFGVVP